VMQPGHWFPERAQWTVAGGIPTVSIARRRGRIAIAAAALISLAVSLPAAAPVAATSASGLRIPACTVTNQTRGGTKGSLAAALKAARAGDTLQVKGTCFGSTTIAKDISIVGKKTPATGVPTLDGNNDGSVIRIREGATVSIKGLVIAHGNANGTSWPMNTGGGIFSAGRLTLRRVTVAENVARDSGGGMRLTGPTTLIQSRVSYNIVSLSGDGCGIATEGRLTIRGGSVKGNVTLGDTCFGAGIVIWNGNVTLEGAATVQDHSAGVGDGGGIAVWQGASLTMLDTSTVTANTASSGGGVWVKCTGSVTFEGGEAAHVFGNTSDDVVREPC